MTGNEPPPATGYARALDELDAILRELESSDVDVDRLADRVARATELIGICRERIGRARLRIDEVIADLDGAAEPPAEPAGAADRRGRLPGRPADLA